MIRFYEYHVCLVSGRPFSHASLYETKYGTAGGNQYSLALLCLANRATHPLRYVHNSVYYPGRKKYELEKARGLVHE